MCSCRHPDHQRALALPPAEQHNLLGVREREHEPPAPHDRMQAFLHTLHDNVSVSPAALHTNTQSLTA